GNRQFSPADVENLKLIYHLVKERGMTLEGANRSLKRNKGALTRDVELLERLQQVRALLEEVRAELRDAAADSISGAVAAVGMPEEEPETVAREEFCPIEGPVRIVEAMEAVEASEAETDPEEDESVRPDLLRRPRRKREKEEPEGKELFAFYEQSLF
ncbi:MAG: MerR family transcriptional regulator, partial [Alistipes sp.]|nr:MerR family transcriptional regulator [Alistipes sp.]